jgi:hypothetical protein
MITSYKNACYFTLSSKYSHRKKKMSLESLEKYKGGKCGKHGKNQLAASQSLVDHTCNPSYSGGRDQEDCSSKPDGANSWLSYIMSRD